MNRRSVVCGLLSAPILFVPTLAKSDPIVEKGIRFLGKYPKVVCYDPSSYFSSIGLVFRFPCEGDMRYVQYTPAPLSVYAPIIEEQRKLGWLEYEFI